MRSVVLVLLLVFAEAFAQTPTLQPAPPLHPIRWYNSRPMTLNDLRGRVVLIVFWATWSNPSVESHPRLAAIADALKGEPFSVILYHSRMTNIQHIHDVKAEKVLPFFIAENRLKLPVAIAGERDFAEFGVIGLPRFVLLDKRGAIRVSTAKVPSMKQIQSLLAENIPTAQQASRPPSATRSRSRGSAPGGLP